MLDISKVTLTLSDTWSRILVPILFWKCISSSLWEYFSFYHIYRVIETLNIFINNYLLQVIHHLRPIFFRTCRAQTFNLENFQYFYIAFN